MEKNEIDWKLVLNEISTHTSCSQSKEKIVTTTPYTHLSLAQNSMEVVEAFKEILVSSKGQRVKLESFEYIESILFSIKKAQTLTVFDLNQVRLFLEDIKAIESLYPFNKEPRLSKFKDAILNVDPLLNEIKNIITESGDIRSDASSLLLDSFNKKRHLSQNIHQTLDKLVKDYSLETILQDRYVTTREGRWVLPVISGKQHDFKGLVHDSSNSKETVFMEPEEVVSLNNKIRELDDVIKKEVERLLKQITDKLHEKINQIMKAFNTAIDIDANISIAEWALDHNANKVTLSSKNKLDIKEGFHPLLDKNEIEIVKNDFNLQEGERILILSGPNAGGKTVFLKTVGLICQMARCGLPVCASNSSTVPFFTNITSVVGDNQSVGESLSTFEAHLRLLNACTDLKGPSEFVLIDEICGSTEAGEGSALARAFIEEYSKNGILAVITSHLGPLKTGWEAESGVVNGSMLFDQKKGHSTYDFVKGVPGDSLAIETAKKAQVDKEIIDRALFFLTPEQRKKYSGLVEIESLQKALQTQKEDYKKKAKELEELKIEYNEMIREFKTEQDELLEKSIKNFQSRLNQNQGYSEIQERLKNKVHLDKMKMSSPKVIKTNQESPITQENFSSIFPPGSPVYVPSLKKNGVVQGTPDSKGFVPIMSDSMRILIKWSDARRVNTNQDGSTKKAKASFETIKSDSIEHEVDLRGQTVDDSLKELEDAIDQTMRLGCERLKVIHGHGTEKIKKNVRSFLSRHPLVKTWKSDSGDGVTVAMF
jgi:DNA mismatch repair protein MutS2